MSSRSSRLKHPISILAMHILRPTSAVRIHALADNNHPSHVNLYRFAIKDKPVTIQATENVRHL